MLSDDIVTARYVRRDFRAKASTPPMTAVPGDLHAPTFVPDRKLLALILASNFGDYMGLELFSHLVSGPGPVLAAAYRAKALTYLGHMLNEGYLTIGDMHEDGYFPWDCGADEALSWIGLQWAPSSDTWSHNEVQEIAWLGNTPHGNDLAAALDRAEVPGCADTIPPRERNSPSRAPLTRLSRARTGNRS